MIDRVAHRRIAFRLLVLAIVPLPLTGWGANLHVANRVSDTGDGSPSAPFTKIRDAIDVAQAGDSILLERGGVFRESDLILPDGVTLSSYGKTELPLPSIRGSEVVGGWQAWEGDPHIYRVPWSTPVSQLYVDGARATLARTPNVGWFRTKSGTGDNTIVDHNLMDLPGNRPGFWTGAQVRWRKWSWWYETREVAGDNGRGRLELGGSTALGKTGIGSGYYLDNTLAALDSPGEWWWDEQAQYLYYYPPAGRAPDDLLIEAMVRGIGLSMDRATVRDVELRHYRERAIVTYFSSVIEDCEVRDCADVGIRGEFTAAGSTVSGCYVHDILNIGISWREDPEGAGGSVIENNRIERIGVVPGLGGSGSWHAAGIVVYRAHNLLIRQNRIEHTGYAGLILQTEGHTVERNFFRYCMQTLNDGAAIYMNTGGCIVRENIILDTIGDLDSSHPWHMLAHGIWPEFLGSYENNQFIRNTVFGSGGDGLWLPNQFHARVEGNIFLSNLKAAMDLGGFEPGRSDGRADQDNLLISNLMGTAAVSYRSFEPQNQAAGEDSIDAAFTYHVYGDRDLQYGSMTGTTFLLDRPSAPIVGAIAGSSTGTLPGATGNRSLSQWSAEEADWADSDPEVVSGAAYPFINDTFATIEVKLPPQVDWRNLLHASVGPTLSIPPFQTVVLLSGAGEVPGMRPYFLASEASFWSGVTYESWAASFALPTAMAGPHADPDGDGYNNLAELYFGMDPRVPDDVSPLSLEQRGAEWILTITRSRRLPPLVAVLQSSTNLEDWVDQEDLSPATGQIWSQAEGRGDLEHTSQSISLGSNERRFWRLRLEEPPLNP